MAEDRDTCRIHLPAHGDAGPVSTAVGEEGGLFSCARDLSCHRCARVDIDNAHCHGGRGRARFWFGHSKAGGLKKPRGSREIAGD